MMFEFRGIVNGKQVNLDHEVNLPAGTVVTVRLETEDPALAAARTLIETGCGVWANDESIPFVFEEILRERRPTCGYRSFCGLE